jgi:GntR family transcriptional regulator, transcriptional repressor for pyruvate dehydrogenase complex
MNFGMTKPSSVRSKQLKNAESRIKPLRRLSLVRGAVAELRERILRGAFDHDDLPSEANLAQGLGVSRTVVREAMRILGAQGLVEVSQGRQARVKAADPQLVVDTFHTYLQRSEHSLLELIEVRRPLEAAIAALAAERATEADVAAMKQTLVQYAAGQSPNGLTNADMRFHELLAESTGNHVFQLLLKTVAGLLRLSRLATLRNAGPDFVLSGHRAILDAVERHNPAAARRAMIEHLSTFERDLHGTTP